MRVEPGSRVGAYEIVSPLGAGGMGVVYRARDTRLGRDVALKFLPADFAEDPERHARFEREAKLLASLNHPHIAVLFGLEHLDGQHALAMELVEGEGLDERIGRGPIPVEEAVAIALQIADALEAAHEKGIVHRDLKPANVRVRPDGTVKVLDFGLAKAWEGSASGSDIGNSPTITAHHTRAGVILGTAAYMSPEQARGKPVDRRADIWAFGCVVLEMLTGSRTFGGDTVTDVIAAVVTRDPDWSALPAGMSPRVVQALKRCMEKDPRRRFRDIGDVRFELEEGMRAGGGVPDAPAPIAAAATPAVPAWRRALPWALSGVFAAAAIAGVLAARRPHPAVKIVRFQIANPESLSDVGTPKVSPDGRWIAFNATDEKGATQVWIRALEDLEAHPMAGTDGATRPFWSPDSRFLGFVAGGKLKKIPIAGGPPQTLADTATGSDGTWSASGVILFDGSTSDPIERVAATGGTPQPLVSPDREKGITQVAWPHFLPDGNHFLYMAEGKKAGERFLMVGAVDGRESGRKLADVGSLAQYAPPGYLLYVREDALLAQPFDAGSLRVTGEAVPLAEHLGPSGVGLADFSVSDEGTVVYRSGWTARRRLVWTDRAGKSLGDADQPAVFGDSALSPDGRTLAITIDDPGSHNRDIWLRDLQRGVTSRFTFDPAEDGSPVFSPDGKTIVFSSTRNGGAPDLYQAPAAGNGEATLLYKTGETVIAQEWSRDGRWLAFNRLGAKTGWDVWALAMNGPDRGKAVPVVQGPFFELRPSFSPDARWLAYQSNESGRPEIYVQPFPGPGGKWQVSSAGGVEPVWSGDGREILYVSASSKLVAVPVSAGATFSAGQPKDLFDVRPHAILLRNRWLANREATRFLFLEAEGSARALPMTVVLNWPEALRSR